MYALRHLLLRSGAAQRIAWGLLLLVLLSRALISGAVMLDPDAAAPDMMVLCSGHGPMRMAEDSLSTGMRDMPDMPGMAAARQSYVPALDHVSAHAVMPDDGKPMSSNADEHDVCPFSAALFAAVAVAFVVILLAPGRAVRRVRIRPRRFCLPISPANRRPPARAPPAFA